MLLVIQEMEQFALLLILARGTMVAVHHVQLSAITYILERVAVAAFLDLKTTPVGLAVHSLICVKMAVDAT